MSVHKQSFFERFLYPYFNRFIQAHEQSQRWTTRHCPACACPVSFDGAAYCAFCGVPLIELVVAMPVDDVSPNTGAIRLTAIEDAVQQAREQARALEPPNTFTGRFKAYTKQGDRPMKAYNRAVGKAK